MWGKKKTSIKRTDVEPGGEKQDVFKRQTSPKKKEKKNSTQNQKNKQQKKQQHVVQTFKQTNSDVSEAAGSYREKKGAELTRHRWRRSGRQHRGKHRRRQ